MGSRPGRLRWQRQPRPLRGDAAMPSGELLPTRTLDRSCAEERLWFAVLTRALKDFINGRPRTRRRIRSHKSDPAHSREAAGRWFFDDSYQVGSFRWVADLFTVDPTVVIGWLLKEDYLNGLARPCSRRCGPIAHAEMRALVHFASSVTHAGYSSETDPLPSCGPAWQADSIALDVNRE